MKILHPTQEKLLDILKRQVDNPLTIEELKNSLGISSKSVVHHHILQLEKRGYLKRNPNNPKDYSILSEPEKQVVYIAMYGLAQCGADGFFLEDSPIDRIPIASRLVRFPSSEAFIVEAKGDSMEPKIFAGDLVIAKIQNTADPGEIIICVNDGVTIIKKYDPIDQNTVILESLNPKHPKIRASQDNFRIVGVLRSVMSYLG